MFLFGKRLELFFILVSLSLLISVSVALKCYQCMSDEECAKDVGSLEVVDPCTAGAPMTAFCIKHTYKKDNRKTGVKAGEVHMRQCAGAEADSYEAGKCYEDTYNVESCYCAEDLCNK